MQRRSLLAAAGAAVGAGVAGCLGALGGPAGEDDSVEGPRELGEAVAVDGVGRVTVESVAVQRSAIDHHVWRDLYEPAEGQLLVVDAAVDAEEPPELPFRARLDGESVDPAMRVPFHESETRYGVSVPVGSVGSAAVVLEGADRPAWRVPAATRERLAAAPEFHLHDAALREEGGETVLELGVENRGDRDGTFRAVVVSAAGDDLDAAVRFPVPAGERVERAVEHWIVDRAEPGAGLTHQVRPGTRRFEVDDA